MSRVKTAEIWLSKPNTVMRKEMLSIELAPPSSFQACATAIRNGEYVRKYDYNQDGYLTPEDYNLMYDTCFRLWDAWADPQQNPYGGSAIDIRALIRIKKAIGGSAGYDAMFDLDGDGVISEIDSTICKFWILVCDPNKPERDDFADIL